MLPSGRGIDGSLEEKMTGLPGYTILSETFVPKIGFRLAPGEFASQQMRGFEVQCRLMVTQITGS